MSELIPEEEAIVDLVREFVDREVRPRVRELEHTNTYPEHLIEHMKRMGIFGLAIPQPWGDSAVSVPCFAAVSGTSATRPWMIVGEGTNEIQRNIISRQLVARNRR